MDRRWSKLTHFVIILLRHYLVGDSEISVLLAKSRSRLSSTDNSTVVLSSSLAHNATVSQIAK